MELNVEQKETVAQWVRDGSSLSDVQKQLQSEFGVSMTYMDVRFLVLDLDVTPVDRKDKPKPRPKPQPPAEEIDDIDALDDTVPFPGNEAIGGGAISLTVDTIVKPGALVSGTVAFSDGKSGTWMLDQFGRLALDVGDPAYRPSPGDLQAFQTELQQALAKRGF